MGEWSWGHESLGQWARRMGTVGTVSTGARVVRTGAVGAGAWRGGVEVEVSGMPEAGGGGGWRGLPRGRGEEEDSGRRAEGRPGVRGARGR